MNRFIRHLIFAILFNIGLYGVSLVIINKLNLAKYIPNVYDKSKNNGFLLSRLREIPNYQDIDLLFIGSSHASREFGPSIFNEYGYSTFNLGSNAQTPLNTRYLLSKYLDQLKPQTVIIEVYFKFFTNDGIESALDIAANSPYDYNTISFILKKPDLKTWNTLCFIYVNRLFEPLEKIEQQLFKTDRYVTGGYIEKNLPDSLNQHLSVPYPKTSIITWKSEQINALRESLSMLNSRGLKSILVAAPISREYLKSFVNYPEFHQKINELAGQYNSDFIDYNMLSTPEFNSLSDFYDLDHLSQKGVVKFNKDFIENYLNNN